MLTPEISKHLFKAGPAGRLVTIAASSMPIAVACLRLSCHPLFVGKFHKAAAHVLAAETTGACVPVRGRGACDV
jgi:hypothetical protein